MSSGESVALRLKGVSFSYASTQVLHDLSFEAPAGEMIALLGASGCGKTTILKLIAGLLVPAAGTIVMDGQPMNGVPAEQRHIGMVFQTPLLFPYLSVEENVGFSLKMRGVPRAEIRKRVLEALAMVRLEGYESRRPSHLSGGQEQRVALARAMVSEPRILLLDEPFASLDENLRLEIRTLVRGIQRKAGVTAIFVTHDRDEAAAMAHRIAFLREGRIEQCGALRDFYTQPATAEAARFFGWQLLRGEIKDGTLQTALGSVAAPAARPVQRLVWAAFRPEDASLALDDSPGASTNGVVETSVDLGTRTRTAIGLNSGEAIEVEHRAPELEPGRRIEVRVAPGALRLFARAGTSLP